MEIGEPSVIRRDPYLCPTCKLHLPYSSTDYNVHYDSYSKFLLNLKSFQILHNNNGVIEVVDRIK